MPDSSCMYCCYCIENFIQYIFFGNSHLFKTHIHQVTKRNSCKIFHHCINGIVFFYYSVDIYNLFNVLIIMKLHCFTFKIQFSCFKKIFFPAGPADYFISCSSGKPSREIFPDGHASAKHSIPCQIYKRIVGTA